MPHPSGSYMLLSSVVLWTDPVSHDGCHYTFILLMCAKVINLITLISLSRTACWATNECLMLAKVMQCECVKVPPLCMCNSHSHYFISCYNEPGYSYEYIDKKLCECTSSDFEW